MIPVFTIVTSMQLFLNSSSKYSLGIYFVTKIHYVDFPLRHLDNILPNYCTSAVPESPSVVLCPEIDRKCNHVNYTVYEL